MGIISAVVSPVRKGQLIYERDNHVIAFKLNKRDCLGIASFSFFVSLQFPSLRRSWSTVYFIHLIMGVAGLWDVSNTPISVLTEF